MKYSIICSIISFHLLTCIILSQDNLSSTLSSKHSNQILTTLCEGFSSTTFPPSGWQVIFSGTNYWSRVAQSGFGVGTGSAYYDMWNAPVGNIQTLITTQFTPTNNGDSLTFDIAFCPYGTVQDSLVILTSTDGGVTYSSLSRLGPQQMATATNCTHPFVPSASNWGRKGYILTAGINLIAFVGMSEFGDGVYLDSICVITPVGIHNGGTETPVNYSLSQNYPNPFNPTTIINYQIPKAGNVKLVVYDVQGKETAILVSQKQSAGSYSVDFNGNDLATGIYFYQLTAGDFTNTKKMLLIK